MIIYHGGYCTIEIPEIREGRYTKDFGTGFYCTEIKEQAIRWSKRYDTPTINQYHFEPDACLKTLHFEEMTEEWLNFIVNCRNGEKHPNDIVIGAMANDQVYNYISDFINGILTREQFWVMAKFKHPTHQINFCNIKALNCLTFISSEQL